MMGASKSCWRSDRRDGAGWTEQITPVHRFLPDPAPIGVWWNSTPPLTVPGVQGQFGITARRIEGGHVELVLQRVTGVHWGERLLPRFGRLDSPRYGPDRIHTSSVDLVDEGPTRSRLGLILDRGDRCRFSTHGRSSWLGPMATRAIPAAPTKSPATNRTGLRVPRSGGSSSECPSYMASAARQLPRRVDRASGARRIHRPADEWRPAASDQRRRVRAGPARPGRALLHAAGRLRVVRGLPSNVSRISRFPRLG